MKRTMLRALALGLTLTMSLALSAGALAAPAADGISVQLDGETLSFSDAAPQVVEGRTFLPFRAIFEAMGAEVSYSASANTVSAQRGDITVTMALGGTLATVERNGIRSEITMDVAPFAEHNRTYVPVRFAAQAFGCVVGWDQDDQTVILVDARRAAETAVNTYTYTLLDRLSERMADYRQGAWATKGTAAGTVSLSGVPILFDAAFEGVCSDSAKVEMSMGMDFDLNKFVDLLETVGALQDPLMSDADTARLESMRDMSMDLQMRGDLSTGLVYMLLEGTGALEESGIPAGTWLSANYNDLFAQAGLGLSMQELMEFTGNLDMADLVCAGLSGVPLSDRDTAYADIQARAAQAAALFADSAFTEVDGGYVADATSSRNGAELGLTLVLETGNGGIAGYSMSLNFSVPAPDGSNTGLTGSLTLAMDDQGSAQAQIQADIPGTFSIDMDMDASYTPSDRAPQTAPPANAPIQSFYDLISANAGVPAR